MNEETEKTEKETEETEPTKKNCPGRLRYIVLGLFLGAAAVVVPLSLMLAGNGIGLKYPDILRKMLTIDRLIDDYYLYDADAEDVSEGIFLGMIYGLSEDDYAAYYTPSAHDEEIQRTNGSYVGIGVTVMLDEEGLGAVVTDVSEKGPASDAGIIPGDIIIGTENMSFSGMSLDTIVSYISGEEGTVVTLRVFRDGAELQITLSRQTIVTSESVHSEIFEKGTIPGVKLGSLRVGYISIREFLGTTTRDFEEALLSMNEGDGVDGIIIDLRNNSGGDFNVCINMLDLLIGRDDEAVYESGTPYEEGAIDSDEGAAIVAVENKRGERDVYYTTTGKETDVPIVVLVNGRSASASEIMAGVLRDYGHEVVGTRTFGKGIVQSMISLSDGSAVKFTTDQYRLPSGEYVHRVGVAPTMEVEFEEFEGVAENSVNFALGEEEENKLSDSQIRAAIDIIDNEAYRWFRETA